MNMIPAALLTLDMELSGASLIPMDAPVNANVPFAMHGSMTQSDDSDRMPVVMGFSISGIGGGNLFQWQCSERTHYFTG